MDSSQSSPSEDGPRPQDPSPPDPPESSVPESDPHSDPSSTAEGQPAVGDSAQTRPKSSASKTPRSGESGPAPDWTPDKVRSLKENFGLRDDLFLSRELGCSPRQLLAKAWEVFDEPLKQGTWSEGDVDLLRRYIGAATPALIGRIVGRKENEVEAKIVDLARDLVDEPFSVDEVVAFKRLYGTRTDEDLALIFGRTVQSITGTATELCLSKDKAFLKRHADKPKPVRMPRWTKEELGQLRELYPEVSNLDIAKKLGRSVKSVVSKAHNLGLKKDKARLQQMGRQNVRLRYKRYDD